MHDGTTPLILAARLAVEGMLEDLINAHADVNAVDDLGKLGCGCGCGARPLPPRSWLTPASHTGKSALHWAAAVNNVEAAVVLLKNGANKDMQNNKVGWAGPARHPPRPQHPGPGVPGWGVLLRTGHTGACRPRSLAWCR